ncbi:MAG: hypothetical protein LBI95_03990 [Holosporales bacterium]|jgi:hypothetical protein|nr:hypothetical protein [Holosporales bacterium]
MNKLLKLTLITLLSTIKIGAIEYAETDIFGTLNLESGWTIKGFSKVRLYENAKVTIGTKEGSESFLTIQSPAILELIENSTIKMLGNSSIKVLSEEEDAFLCKPAALLGSIDLSEVTDFSEYEGIVHTMSVPIVRIPPPNFSGVPLSVTTPPKFCFHSDSAKLFISYKGSGEAEIGLDNNDPSKIVIKVGSIQEYTDIAHVTSVTGLEFEGDPEKIILQRDGTEGDSAISLEKIAASLLNVQDSVDKTFNLDQDGILKDPETDSIYASPQEDMIIHFGLEGSNNELTISPESSMFNLSLDGADNSGLTSDIFLRKGDLKIRNSAPNGNIMVQDGALVMGYDASTSPNAAVMEFNGEIEAKKMEIPRYSTVVIKGKLVIGSEIAF